MKAYISELLSQAIQNISPDEAEAVLGSGVFDVSYPKPGFGDYASNAAMVLFKKFNSAPAPNPAEFANLLASKISELDHKSSFSKVEAVGGFLNFTLSEPFLLNRLSQVLEEAQDYGKSAVGDERPVIVEYFQNNIAKPPHVGHLRSAVIGDSLVRILKFVGYKTISDTHIGDWGVQFGILLHAYKEFIKDGGDKEQIEKDPVIELNKLYVDFSAKIEENAELRDLGKAEFQKLEAGDVENRDLWEWFVKVSLDDFERYRQLLGILPFDHNLGESFYENQMAAVLESFEQLKLITVGETNEIYVDLEAHGLGRCILVKSDGATTYHLRDFATYIYRKAEFDFYRNLYIVDVRQSHHFRQLFKVLELAGFSAETDSAHLDFGFMSLPEGAISTRKGNTISLENLISEAEKRARAIIEEKNPDLADKDKVTKQVALAAIKYFDLSHNRQTEIVFNWDQALSFEGNTGPYLQYTHARIHGIFRKAQEEGLDVSIGKIDDNLRLDALEAMVLRKIQQFPEIVEIVAHQYLPNLLTNYLFELAQNFNSFYQELPVLKEEDSQKRSLRLSLVKATAQVLANGLNLLGIEAPEEM
jgi:arginyl-tRNA synthetase